MRRYDIILIVISLVLGVLYWLIDALVDVFYFHQGAIAAQLFAPLLHEALMRSLTMLLLVLFSLSVMATARRRRQTASALAVASLRAEDEKARAAGILDAIGDGVSIQGMDYRVLYQNHVHRKLMGDHVGRYCYEAYEKSDSTCSGCPTELAYRDGGVHTVERTAQWGRGARSVEITASPLRDAAGNIIAGVEIVRDITVRKETERALRETAEKFRTIFDESKDVFYISTVEGKFLDINPAGVELFGYSSKEELLSIDIGRDLYAIPQDRKQFIDVVDRTSYSKDYEVQMKRKNGEKLWVIITSTAIRDPRGKVVAFRGIIRDVTAHKKLEQQLLHSHKMEAIGLLAGGIAHDFNNILTAIIGYTNLLLKQVKDNNVLRGHAEQVLEASERAARLTKSILAFSRKQVLDPHPVDLNEIIGRVEKFLARLIGEDIALKAVLKGADLTVMADSGQIEQVLINLATNARDAMPGGGSIVIETSTEALDEERVQATGVGRPGAYAVVTVADTGMGIDDETRGRIFEPFFTTKEVGKGTGLGLSIVYGIVDQHGGHITVESDPGQGTAFKVYLPLLKQEAARNSSAGKESVAPRGGTETVLVAEDDAGVRSLARQILEGAGYTVIEATSGDEAIARFSENRDRIALVVLDVVMPNKNGKEAYDAIRKQAPAVRALFTSGYTGDIMHKKGILDADLDFIAKPLSATDFLNRVREMLDR